jgi:quinol monooxygenase YgiN
MVTKALLVEMEAKIGHEEEVEAFLRKGLELVDQEPATLLWFAYRSGPSTFGIFDAFPDDAGRQAHLEGDVAKQLMARSEELFKAPPKIQKLDLLAAKVPALERA